MNEQQNVQAWMESLGWEKHANFWALKDDSELTTTMSGKAATFFYRAFQAEVLRARIDTIDKIFELSPKGSFQNWKPTDAFQFYERLKAYEQEIQAQLKERGKES